jgi:hypothetical protein
MEHLGDLSSITASFPNQKLVISCLINSMFYSIRTCFIISLNSSEFRLQAVHGKKVLADRKYPTLRGTRIAFKKQFKNMSWRDDVAAEWSHLYPVDREWIEEKLSTAAKAVY